MLLCQTSLLEFQTFISGFPDVVDGNGFQLILLQKFIFNFCFHVRQVLTFCFMVLCTAKFELLRKSLIFKIVIVTFGAFKIFSS